MAGRGQGAASAVTHARLKYYKSNVLNLHGLNLGPCTCHRDARRGPFGALAPLVVTLLFVVWNSCAFVLYTVFVYSNSSCA